MFLLPFQLVPQVYVALLIWFFFLVNIVKVSTTLGMGIVTVDSLWVSAILPPIMPFGMLLGKHINQKIPKEPFYVIIHILLVFLGIYLIASTLGQM